MSRDVKPITLNFKGGLNTFSDMSAISDNQVVEALNFDMDLDGSLKSRPPLIESAPLSRTGTGAEARFLLWYYEDGVDYAIFSEGARTVAWNKATKVFTQITSAFAAAAAVQWQNKLWIIPPWVPGTTLKGGSWTALGGYENVANMPAGSTMVAYKERLFIARGPGSDLPSRLFYSNVFGSSSLWNASPSFQEIGSGDGQAIVYVTTYYSNLLVFRTESIWTWAYSASPESGQISVLVPGVGLSDRDAVASYENTLYFMYDSKAYAFLQNRAEHINPHVPFKDLPVPAASFHAASVSVFNKRILFLYRGVTYVFSTLTSSWTRWVSQQWGPIGRFFQSAFDDVEVTYALTSSTLNTSNRILKADERVSTSAEAGINCVLQTKNYSFEVPSNYKILHRWGLDAIFRDGVKAWAVPINLTSIVTWGQLLNYAWEQVKQGTWNLPVPSDPVAVESDVSAGVYGGSGRKYVKFRKRLRFRQIYFRIEMTTDGSLTSAPLQIFAVLVFVDTRQGVVKTVS